MATTAATPTSLTVNTASASLTDAAQGVVATTPADGWVIAATGIGGDRLLLKFAADASGDTVVIVAGDRPPSQRSGLGNLSITLGASEVKYVAVEAGRFLQDDGTLLATCGDAGTRCSAFILPKRA